MSIRSEIDKAWNEIADRFERGRISSEATLQAHLAASLAAMHPDLDIFCEAALTLEDGQTRYPDILVVTGPHVLAVIEIKFSPEAPPRRQLIADDLAKLRHYARSRLAHHVRMNPRSGHYGGQPVFFNETSICAFAIIAPSASLPMIKKCVFDVQSFGLSEVLLLEHRSS
jgi:hypothetical protein